MLETASQDVGNYSENSDVNAKHKKVLKALERTKMTMLDLSRETGIPKSTLYDSRHVPALVKMGKVRWEGSHLALVESLEAEVQVRKFVLRSALKPELEDAAIAVGLPPAIIEPAYYKAMKDWRPSKDDTKWVC